MVERKSAVALLFLLLSLSLTLPACADLLTTMKITGITTLLHEEEAVFTALALGRTRLDIKSTGNSNVKGQFQLDALISDEIFLDIPRAYIKIRFPIFRLTLGKTRVSWGDGFLFNAGDVIFDGMSLLTSISATELRENTDWMIVPYLPLGTFSYIEAILLPHPLTDENTSLPTGLELDRLDAGGRAVTKLLGHKLEAGYLYGGLDRLHLPYLSVKGNLLTIDWYLASSLAIPIENYPDEQEVKEGWAISVGLFRLFSLPASMSLSFRAEAGIRPFGEWEEISPSHLDSDYGLYLFPEVAFSPSDSTGLSLRSIISPVDASALNFLGFDWNIYQGFTLSFFFSFMIGDADDHFGWWNRAGDLTFTTQLEYIFGST